jgi:hypothetical protein
MKPASSRAGQSSMKSTLIAGIALIIGGAAVLGYEYTYTTKEQVLKIGPVEATAEKEHTVSLPPILGWVLVAGGVCVLILGLSRKN